jgi:sec-independent protein translocase protein TatA
MLRQIGPFELLIVLLIVVVIFGVGRLSEVGGALGKTIREFRKEVSRKDEENTDEEQEDG